MTFGPTYKCSTVSEWSLSNSRGSPNSPPSTCSSPPARAPQVRSPVLLFRLIRKLKQRESDDSDCSSRDEYAPSGLSFVKLNCGMENPGNVCFANSIIQALSACPSIVFYLFGNRAENQLKPADLAFNNKLLWVLLGLNQTSQAKAQKIDELVSDLQEGGLDFSQQQDSHEFLKALCDKLEAVEKLKTESRNSLMGLNRGPVTDEQQFPFSGKMMETLQCLTCHTSGVSSIHEFFDITFLVNFLETKTVDTLFQEFFAGEMREGVYCAKCSLDWFTKQLTDKEKSEIDSRLAALPPSDLQDFDTLGFLIRKSGRRLVPTTQNRGQIHENQAQQTAAADHPEIPQSAVSAPEPTLRLQRAIPENGDLHQIPPGTDSGGATL